MPKELLPVAGIPLVEWVARECGASGITDLVVVTAPEKQAIVEHLARRAGVPGFPERIHFTVQPVARGLADAVRLGQSFVPDAPLAVALPDNLFVGDAPAIEQVIASYYRTGRHVVGVVEIAATESAQHGATPIYAGSERGDEFEITTIPDKDRSKTTFDTQGAPAAWTGVGRYVLLPDVWPVIDEVQRRQPADLELDDIAVLQRLLANRRLVGCRVRGDFLDAGLPSGYADANARLRPLAGGY